MDDKGTKPPSDQGFSLMMREMMEGMCGGRECSPAAMCQAMMRRMCNDSNASAQGTPEVQKDDKKA